MSNDLVKLVAKSIILSEIIKDNDYNKYKLVVYSDSLECTYCDLKNIGEWEPYIEYSKSMNEKLAIYFIFCPSNNEIELTKNILKSTRCDYNIFIDEQNDFEKRNPHLPKNKAMHTFLLDENNNVILVGNPLQNKKIEKLFYKITQELLAK